MSFRQNKFFFKHIARVLCTVLVVQTFTTLPTYVIKDDIAAAATAATTATTPVVTLQSEEPITSGAMLRKYVWSSTRGSQPVQANVDVVVIDLQNPNVRLDVMTGTQGQLTRRQTVRGMATETKAVAATNGDFFNTAAEGVPMGPEISGGKLLSTPQLYTPGFYNFAITKDNKPVIDLFTFQGSVKTKDGATYPLDGINKSYYWYEEPVSRHSHDDSMFIYTDAWARVDRAVDRNTDLTEVLVQNNTVTQITYGLSMIAPKDGYILRTEGKAAQFVYAHMKVGDPITANYALLPADATKTYDTGHFKMMIGGQTILVDQGKAADFSRSDADLGGYRSRTGVGYSQDARYAFLIAVERNGTSSGMSLTEFQQVMLSVGVWKGMNLDGGGSTQMVARPLGEQDVKLVNQTENGSERQVVNSLGVFSTAPQGQLKGLKIQGNTTLFLNEKASFTVKPYDEYYNPMGGTFNTVWGSSSGIGTFEGNTFNPTAKGTATLTAAIGNVTQNVNVQVVGRDDIESLKLISSNSVLMENQNIKLSLRVRTKSGVERVISANGFPIELRGFKGEINGDTVHVTSLAGSTMGQFIVRYDGFSTMLTLPLGQKKLWADFDTRDVPVMYDNYPSEVTGSVAKTVGWNGADPKNNSILLKYNFTLGTGNKAVYAVLGNGGSGVLIDGQPQMISVNASGDNSLNMLRAEVVDADGDLNRIDIVKNINWTGWKTVTADLTGYHLAYPITLKRIYVASPALGQDERAKVGTIAIDDVSFQYKIDAPQPGKNQVKLTIDQKTLTLNGKNVSIDQAPVIIDGSTMVPVRFVVEDLGGKVEWLESEQKATVLRSNLLIDLWVGKTGLIVNGETITSPVAPRIMNNRTMVPLRVLSENLGWKVTWDEKTRSVLLE